MDVVLPTVELRRAQRLRTEWDEKVAWSEGREMGRWTEIEETFTTAVGRELVRLEETPPSRAAEQEEIERRRAGIVAYFRARPAWQPAAAVRRDLLARLRCPPAALSWTLLGLREDGVIEMRGRTSAVEYRLGEVAL